jgi:hypothetical protein
MPSTKLLIALYLCIAEISALILSSSLMHAITDWWAIPFIIMMLWWAKTREWSHANGIPYKSVPVLFLAASLLFQVWFIKWPMDYGSNERVVRSGMIVPIAEELLYRFALVSCIESRLNSHLPRRALVGVSLVVSTALFTFAHRKVFQIFGDWLVCLISSIALCMRFVRGRNLLEIVSIHALHNMHAFLNEPGNDSILVPFVFYSAIAIYAIVSIVRRS